MAVCTSIPRAVGFDECPESPVSCPPLTQSTLIAVLLPFAAAGPESAVEHGVRERTPLYWMNGPSTLSQHSESAS